jgi:hypothetical protein
MIQLDMALTGKARHVAEHTARTQTEFGPLGERINPFSREYRGRKLVRASESLRQWHADMVELIGVSR